MTDPYETLRAALAAATPGPWEVLDGVRVSVVLPSLTPECGYDSHCVAITHTSYGRLDAKANAAYIAACQPAAISALLLERDALLQRAEAAEAEVSRLRPLTVCGCGDGFTEHDPGTCGNCLASLKAGAEAAERNYEKAKALLEARATVDQVAAEREDRAKRLGLDVESLQARAEAAEADARRLKHVGAQLADVAFNWAQKPGHALTSDDVSMLDKLRRAWDAAMRGE